MQVDSVLKNTGARLRKARISMQMTLDDVAELTGASKAMLSKYENGTSNLKIEILVQLLSLYEVDANYILGTHPYGYVTDDGTTAYRVTNIRLTDSE